MRPPQKAAATTASNPQKHLKQSSSLLHVPGIFPQVKAFRGTNIPCDNSLTDSTLVDNRYAVLELSYLSAISSLVIGRVGRNTRGWWTDRR